ncbi:MAG: type II secretion system protein [Sideroxyarcus sp.]|nr:type II secretion system protein [Sideroxyarcus sp.]
MKKQQGFTLIELIVVIVILGILAATALPRFTNLSDEARVASVNGITGAIRSAVAITRAQYLATGSSTAATALLGATTVDVNVGTGIPLGTIGGIGAALESTEGYDVNYTTPAAVTFTPTGAPATCTATYNGTTGAAAASASAAAC